MDNYPINNSQDALLIEINYYITYIYLYLNKKILENIHTFCGFIPIVRGSVGNGGAGQEEDSAGAHNHYY